MLPCNSLLLLFLPRWTYDAEAGRFADRGAVAGYPALLGVSKAVVAVAAGHFPECRQEAAGTGPK